METAACYRLRILAQSRLISSRLKARRTKFARLRWRNPTVLSNAGPLTSAQGTGWLDCPYPCSEITCAAFDRSNSSSVSDASNYSADRCPALSVFTRQVVTALCPAAWASVFCRGGPTLCFRLGEPCEHACLLLRVIAQLAPIFNTERCLSGRKGRFAKPLYR
jgi:hypothetical protein